ncbi:MAG: hypothetical protein KatS3mg103_0595 [Phycisphaerales bacterium]|nr:MAG: hypothetical protein KatS3mg103_0595 [Phycisphaerales bacterium]
MNPALHRLPPFAPLRPLHSRPLHVQRPARCRQGVSKSATLCRLAAVVLAVMAALGAPCGLWAQDAGPGQGPSPIQVTARQDPADPADDPQTRRQRLIESVERWSRQAHAGTADPSARLEALRRAMDARRQLLEALPDDPHRPIWLLDQAGDTLSILSIGLDDARLVVGLPAAQARARAVQLAQQAAGLADEAVLAIDRRLQAQRSLLDAGGEPTEADRTLNRRLAEAERAVRAPLLKGRALALLVADGQTVQQAQALEKLLTPVRLPAGLAGAWRDASLAIALAARRDADARARAAELLESVASQPQAPPALRAEAALSWARLAEGPDEVLARIDRVTAAEPFLDADGLVEASLAVLAAEARARTLLEAGRIDRAVEAIASLAERRDLGGTAEQRRALADDRLAALAERVGRSQAWASAEPATVLRSAWALVRAGAPERDGLAQAVLEGLLDRLAALADQARRDGRRPPFAAEHRQATALLARLCLVRARSLSQDGLDDAARDLQARGLALACALLEPHGGASADSPDPATPDERADGADLAGLVEAAATLAIGPAGQGLSSACRKRLLVAAIERSPGDARADRWRLGLAALVLETDRDHDRALALAARALASSDPQVRAQATELAAALHALRIAPPTAPIGALREALDFARAHRGVGELAPEHLALRLAERLLEDDAPDPRQARAEATEALEVLATVQGPQAAGLRGVAMARLGRAAEAVAQLRLATQALTPQADGPAYWRAWTVLLELVNEERLRRLDQGQTASAGDLERSLRAYLLKLAGIDADLGGPPYAQRLRAVQASLDRPG